MENSKYAAEMLKASCPSDEVFLDKGGLDEIMSLYDKVVGERDNGIADIILSQTVPIPSLRIKLEDDAESYRFCVFENALDHLDEAPAGRALLVAAVLEEKAGRLTLLGVIKGDEKATVSDRSFDEFGNDLGKSDTIRISGLWHIWCAVEFALLHPQSKTIFTNPAKGKEYVREKDSSGKRRRVVKYIRRHYITGTAAGHSIREINRHCLCWYVVGHWRHLRSGNVIYIKGYWKGELRDLKRNVDSGRIREIAIPESL